MPSVTKPCFSGLSTFAGCSVKPAEPGHQRAVVAAAAHLQRAAVPRLGQVDLELHVRRGGVLRFHDADHLAELAVRVALLGCGYRDGCLHDRTAGWQADRRRRDRHSLQARTR